MNMFCFGIINYLPVGKIAITLFIKFNPELKNIVYFGAVKKLLKKFRKLYFVRIIEVDSTAE